jgi:ABC-type multidrug transport system ATPase subunit
LLDRN